MFGKLKSLFILEDKNETIKAAQKAEENQKAIEKEQPTVSAKDITVNIEPQHIPKSGKPDSKFIDILLKAVEKDNLEGFDYLEYKSSLQSLSGMDMDEETRYKSSLAMAQTMGASADKLIKTAKHYLSSLNKEKSKFQDALKAQKTKQVTSKESGIKEIQKGILGKKNKIAELQKEIERDTKKMESMKAGINKAAAKVQKTSDNFHYAFNVVTGQILADIEKIQKYLK
ncbi:MAG: hypothetical protein P1U56_11690 [Saprospiraceae bacterium]|nr:hypothetical protein [Saprospiraceae bacterium]